MYMGKINNVVTNSDSNKKKLHKMQNWSGSLLWTHGIFFVFLITTIMTIVTKQQASAHKLKDKVLIQQALHRWHASFKTYGQLCFNGTFYYTNITG